MPKKPKRRYSTPTGDAMAAYIVQRVLLNLETLTVEDCETMLRDILPWRVKISPAKMAKIRGRIRGLTNASLLNALLRWNNYLDPIQTGRDYSTLRKGSSWILENTKPPSSNPEWI
jgi:hypothetical protein